MSAETEDCTPRMGSFILGLSPPNSVINIGPHQQPWLHLLHLLATHRPPAQPVQELPAKWETATPIALGKHKQTEFWIEGSGQASRPQLGWLAT